MCPIPGPHSCLSLPAYLLCEMDRPWALLSVLWALGATTAVALRIGAFNIQSFGDSKVSDSACGSIIAQVRPGAGGQGCHWAPPENLWCVTPPLWSPSPDPGWV